MMSNNAPTPPTAQGQTDPPVAARKRRFLDLNNAQTFANSLTMPARLVLFSIIIFPLLTVVYISMT
ncbi:MAG: hypothetical protein GWN58_03045, partial [Anaerolineae bacterium]|nr:hypothetical protein [Anaerolineae bacterium]